MRNRGWKVVDEKVVKPASPENAMKTYSLRLKQQIGWYTFNISIIRYEHALEVIERYKDLRDRDANKEVKIFVDHIRNI